MFTDVVSNADVGKTTAWRYIRLMFYASVDLQFIVLMAIEGLDKGYWGSGSGFGFGFGGHGFGRGGPHGFGGGFEGGAGFHGFSFPFRNRAPSDSSGA